MKKSYRSQKQQKIKTLKKAGQNKLAEKNALKWNDTSWCEPRSLFHSFAPLLLQDPNQWLEPFHHQYNTGVSVSEDERNIYVEASLPGILPEEITINYNHGVLCITADKKEEVSDKKKTFYKKAHKNFFYQIALPASIDETKEPNALCKNGVLKITFHKAKNTTAKNKIISVKRG